MILSVLLAAIASGAGLSSEPELQRKAQELADYADPARRGRSSVASKDCAAFGKIFAPSAYLNWPIASNLDPDKVHELEIRPVLGEGEMQEVNIESVCVAGRNGAWVKEVN